MQPASDGFVAHCGFKVTYILARIDYGSGWFKAMKTKSEGWAMKREYEKPQFSKAAVTLQAVTAQRKVTGTGLYEAKPK